MEAKEILEKNIKMPGLLNFGNYLCVGIPYGDALNAVKEALQQPLVSGQLADYLQNVIGKKYSIYFEQQDIDGLIEAANCTKPVSGGSARYIIIDKSVSAHCCFECTIIDTAAGKEDYRDYWKRSMCETFDRAEAEIICDALNKHGC